MNKLCKAAAWFGYTKLCGEEPVSLEVEQAFAEHVSTYGLMFGTKEEYEFRMNLFAKKDAEIKEINAREKIFTVGHNYMSTLTDYEFQKMLGYRAYENAPVRELSEDVNDDGIDWRTKGVVNMVKNQGQCGSCWAFSAVSSMESAWAIKTGKLENFSEQQIVDCVTDGAQGCSGGFQESAFKYLETHGIERASDYGYTARGGECKYDPSKAVCKVSQYTMVPANSVAQLKSAIKKQPVSVTIEADEIVFQMYSGGILDSKDCGTSLDHAVEAVGYGTEGGIDYYIVRNSWGSSWGDRGYIKIAAVDGPGICGIQMHSVYPTVQSMHWLSGW